MSRYIYAITLALQVTINQYAFSGECATGTAPSAGCTVGVDDTTYTMTGNITPVDLNTSINKTRPVVTLGATYYIAPINPSPLKPSTKNYPTPRTVPRLLTLTTILGFD